MSQDRIDSIIDLQATGNEVKLLTGQIDSLIVKLKEAQLYKVGDSSNVQQLTAANAKLEKSFVAVNSAATTVSTTLNTIATNSKEVAAAVAIDTKAVQDNITVRRTLQSTNKSLLADQKEDLALLKAGVITRQEYFQRVTAATAAIEKNKIVIADLNKEIKQQILLENSLADSQKATRAENKVLTQRREGLSTTQDAGQIAAINAQIDRNNQLLDLNSSKLEKQKINIGNYPTVFKGAFDIAERELNKVNAAIHAGTGNTEDLVKKQKFLQGATTILASDFNTLTSAQAANKQVAQEFGLLYGKNDTTFKEFSKAVAAGNVQIVSVDKSLKGAAGAAGIAKKAFSGLRTLANILPGIGISGLLLFAIDPLIQFVKYINEATGAQKKFIETQKLIKTVNEAASDSYGKDAASLVVLKSKIEDANKPMADRLEAVKKIQEQYPDYFKNLTTEQILAGEVSGAYDKLTESLIRNARAHAAEAEIDKLEAEKLKIRLKNLQDVETTNDKIKNAKASSAISTGGDFGGSQVNKTSAEEAKRLIIEQYNLRKKVAQDEINALNEKEAILLKIAVTGDTTEKDKNNGGQSVADLIKLSNTEFEVYKLRQQRIIDFYNTIASDDAKSYDVRANALTKFSELSKKLSNEQEAYDIAAKKRETAREIENLTKDITGKNKAHDDRVSENIKRTQQNSDDQLTLIHAKAVDDRLKIDISSAKKQEQLFKEFQDKNRAAQLTIDKNALNQDAEGQKRISDSIVNSFSERITAYGQYVKDQQDLIEADYQNQLSTQKLNAQQSLALQSDRDKKLVELAIRSKKEISDIFVSDQKEILSVLESVENANLTAEEKRLFDRLKRKSDFAKQDRDLQLATQEQILKDKIISDGKIFLSDQASAEEKEAAAKRLFDNTNALDKNQLEQKKQNAADELEIYKQTEAAIINLAQETQNTIFQLFLKRISNEIEALGRQSDEVDKEAQRQIDILNQLGLSEEERTKRQTAIEKQAAFDKIQIEKKIGEAKEKQARLQKASDIAGIITATALAIVNALKSVAPPYNFVLAGLVGALGAVQLGVAAATPIPHYEKGTGSARPGLAVAGEKGSELIQRRDGSTYLTPPVPTLMHFEGGEKITPAHLTKDILNAAAMKSIANIQPNKPVKEADVNFYLMKDMLQELRTANRKTSDTSVNVSVDGWFYKHFKS